MLLAIDIGNSNVVIGCLNDKNETASLFRMVTDQKKTEDEYAAGMTTASTAPALKGRSSALLCRP